MIENASSAGVRVPRIVFFDEEKGFQFLATEFVEYSGVCVRGVQSEGNRRIID